MPPSFRWFSSDFLQTSLVVIFRESRVFFVVDSPVFSTVVTRSLSFSLSANRREFQSFHLESTPTTGFSVAFSTM